MAYHSSVKQRSDREPGLWYLGIDWGTTGISAVLLNYSTHCFYPLERFQALPGVAGVPLKPCLDWGLAGRAILEEMAKQLQGMRDREGYKPEIWSQLSGVIVGCPAHWSDAYRFNLREGILRTGWVDRPDQILFLEEPIALVISELRDMAQGTQWQGATLILDSGATKTEFALVDIPLKRSELKYEDFHVGSLAYGGDAIDQDIMGQLLLGGEHPFLPGISDGELGIRFPQPGEVDLETRCRLAEYLGSSEWGQGVLAIAREVKYRLQIENQITVRLEQQQWTIKRRDLEMKVFVPFLRALSREVNRLFSQTGVAPQGIRQALCTGGSASLTAIARWLRQKLPSAAIIQDRIPQGQLPKCSRVAYGLANLPLYPQVLNTVRHQYSDYFLLLELLRVMPDEAIAESQIFHLLEQRGINTAVCGDRLRQLLRGYLPPGLHPKWGQDGGNREFNEPLFSQQPETRLYTLNPEQNRMIHHQFQTVLEGSYQTLDDPYLLIW
ncbi:hypothetical protein PMG71_14425 [Roseofilum sp. BLCC_M154]|uniref:Uncharacterized protein n=1 Tax=Roseofilum acuticapitatum BLCC-M154 TaxID=3022444 RepID=A0ABT7AUP4_9CYAN|nr:hypothetical protein [Roseofilum acuticapitatum]MDJ1170624.1 hypothetical protein [Roseofilum acuticapitatum BLCC-M154]